MYQWTYNEIVYDVTITGMGDCAVIELRRAGGIVIKLKFRI